MKHYRIIRKTKKHISVYPRGGRQISEVRENIWYVAKARFLWVFWFSIGHVIEDYLLFEDTIEHTASTRQEMEEYLQAWHEVHYGKEEYKIDYKV